MERGQTKLIEWGRIVGYPADCEVRRGRRPLNGVRPMTGAERARRYRERRNTGKPNKTLPPIKPELLPGPLTAQIARDSFVRRLIDASFPKLSFISRACNRKLSDQGLHVLPRIHEQPVMARLAGTAIDYRLRAYFRRDMHRTEVVERGLFFFRRWSPKGDYLDALFESFERFVARVKPERRRLGLRAEDRMCRYSILFAYLDWIDRVPLGSSAIEVLASMVCGNIGKTLSRIDDTLVADVVGLSRRFHDQHAPLIRKAKRYSSAARSRVALTSAAPTSTWS